MLLLIQHSLQFIGAFLLRYPAMAGESPLAEGWEPNTKPKQEKSADRISDIYRV